jgi:hypothetical protein
MDNSERHATLDTKHRTEKINKDNLEKKIPQHRKMKR